VSTWPDRDGSAVEHYVRQLRVLHPKTRQLYRSDLLRFQRFIQDHGGLSIASIRAWLGLRSKQWPPYLLIDRACKVNRFLEYLVVQGALASQPFTELRSQHGIRSVTDVVRALLSSRPASALEAARRQPPFASFLGTFLKEYIELRRAVGYGFKTQADRFSAFDRFLQTRADLEGKPISMLVCAWESTAKTLEQRWLRQLMGRDLAKAWARIDPTAPRMTPDRQLKRRVLAARRRPHTFSAEEIKRILDTARTFPSPRTPLRAQTLYTMAVLAYCAGLRIGEVVHLDLGDVSLDDGTITVRDTKFFKSRRLPLSESALGVLRDYLRERSRHGGQGSSGSPLFWRQTRGGGGRYARVTVEVLMEQVLRRANLKPQRGRRGPRFHDLRHSFVSHRMAEWYRDGINPQSHLPYLATYLGHRDIYSTLVYLNTTPELLHLASERFRVYVQSVGALTGRPS
jgi:integrase